MALSSTTFASLFTFSGSGERTYIDSGGALQTAADGVARTNAYRYVGGVLTGPSLYLESEAATQLLHTTDALVTQSVTVSAQPYTLHFTGTGSVTLSGASTAGPLNGTGTGEANRVSLTFTPSAGTLTLTVSGTVSDAQLEAGSIPTSYIPNLAASGTVTRSGEALKIAAANMPSYTDAICFKISGTMNYVDNNTVNEVVFYSWEANSSNNLLARLITGGTASGSVNVAQSKSAVTDGVTETSPGSYTQGLNVEFSFASRHGSNFINVAVDGTALTANTTPTAIADLSAVDFEVCPTFNGHIDQLLIWNQDIGDAGIAEASA